MHVRSLACAAILLSALGSRCAFGSTILFSGTGQQDSIRLSFELTGDNLGYRLSTHEGPYAVAVCPSRGAPCEIAPSYFAGTVPKSDFVGASAMFGGVTTDLVTGFLSFRGVFDVPDSQGAFEATIPVAFSAGITGYAPPRDGHGYTVLFELLLRGTGMASLGGMVDENGIVVQHAAYSFTGAGAEVPEPGTWSAAAGALSGLLIIAKRRRTG